METSQEPQAKTTPKKYDYFFPFAAGQSSEEIDKGTLDGSVELLSRTDADKKYRGENGPFKGMSDTEFNETYDKASQSYNEYKHGKFNGNVAEAWMYDKGSLSGNKDLVDAPVMHGLPGYDQSGQRTASDQEVATARGYIEGQDGTKKPYESPGFFKDLWYGAAGLTGVFHPSLAPILRGDDPDQVSIIKYDANGRPYWKQVASDSEEVVGAQLLSAYGPNSLKQNWVVSAIKTIYNGVAPAIMGMEGSALELSDNMYDFLVNGKDTSGWAETLGKKFQAKSKEGKMPISVRGEQAPFSNAESTINSVAAMLPMILLTKGAASGLGAAGMGTAVAPSVVAHSTASFAVFGGLGMDSFNEMGKSIGMDSRDLVWMAPLLGALQGAIGLWAGPKILTRGVDNMAGETAIKKIVDGLRTKVNEVIGKEMQAIGASALKNETPEMKAAFVKRISGKLSEMYQGTIGKLSPGDYTVFGGRILDMSIGGGRMMALMDIPDVGLQTLNDMMAWERDPNAAPGRKQFEEYDQNKSFFGNVIDRAPKKMVQSFATGFLGSLATGMMTPSTYKAIGESTIDYIVAKGQEAKLNKIIDRYQVEGKFAPSHINEKGEIITSETPDATTMNNAVSKMLKDRVNFLVDLRDTFGLNSPVAALAMGKDAKTEVSYLDFATQALDIVKELKQLKEDKESLPNKADITDEEKFRLKNIDKLIELKQKQLDYYVKPREVTFTDSNGVEHKAERSAAYKDKLLEYKVFDLLTEAAAKKKTEATGKTKEEIERLTKKYKEDILTGKDKDSYEKIIEGGDVFSGMLGTIRANYGFAGAFGQEIGSPMQHKDKDGNLSFPIATPLGSIFKALDDALISHNESRQRVRSKEEEAQNVGDITTGINKLSEDKLSNLDETKKTVEGIKLVVDHLRDEIAGSTKESYNLNEISEISKKHLAEIDKAIESLHNEMKESPEQSIPGIIQSLEDVKKTIQGFGSIERATTLKVLTKDMKMDILDKAVKNLSIEEITGLPGDKFDINWFLEHYKPAENTQYESYQTIMETSQILMNRLDQLKSVFDANVDIFQRVIESNPTTKEHSPVLNDNYKISHDTRVSLNREIDRMIFDLQAIYDKAKNSKIVKDLELAGLKIRHTGLKFSFLRYLSIHHDKSMPKEFKDKFVELQKILRDNGLVTTSADEPISFDNLWKQYQDADKLDGKEKIREDLKTKVILPAEKLIADMYDSLSGKLQGIEDEFAKQVLRYSNTYPFASRPPIDEGKYDNFRGVLSPGGYTKGMITFMEEMSSERKSATDEKGFFQTYTLVQLHRINNLGKEKIKGEKLSYGEHLQVIRDIEKQMNTNPLHEFAFGFNEEQKEVILHALMFAENPDIDYLRKTNGETKDKGTYIENSLIIQGYQGVGKSTMIPMSIIMGRHISSGKRQKVLVVTVNDYYKKNYTDLQDAIANRLHDNKLSMMTVNDFLDKGDNLDYDMIFFEESTSYGAETLELMGEIISKNKDAGRSPVNFWIADDNQIAEQSNVEAQRNDIQNIGERTLPMTTIWSTGYKIAHQLNIDLRNSRGKDTIIFKPTLCENKGLDGIHGIYNFNHTSEKSGQLQVVEDFLADIGMEDTPSDRILLLYNTDEYDALFTDGYSGDVPAYIQEIKDKVGSQLKAYQNKVFVLAPNPDRTELFASGMRSNRVYMAVDVFDRNDDRIYQNGKIVDNAIQIAITGLGRMKEYFSWVCPEENREGDLKKFEKSDPHQREIDLTRNYEDLSAVTKDEQGNLKSTYKDKQDAIEHESVFDRESAPIDPEELKRKTVEHQNKLRSTTTKGGESVTSRMWNTIREEILDSVEEKDREALSKDMDKNKVFNSIIRKVMLNIMDPDGHPIENVEADLAEYSKVMGRDFGMGFINAMRYTLHSLPELRDMMKDLGTLTFVTPLVITKDGQEGHPTIVHIVGHKDGKAIVDMYDFNYTGKMDHHMETILYKNGVYAAGMMHNGFIINDIKIVNVGFETVKEELKDMNITQLSDDQKLQALKIGAEETGLTDIPRLASQDELYSIERQVDHVNDVNERTMWEKEDGSPIFISKISAISDGKGNMKFNVYVNDGEEMNKAIPYDEFVKSHLPFSEVPYRHLFHQAALDSKGVKPKNYTTGPNMMMLPGTDYLAAGTLLPKDPKNIYSPSKSPYIVVYDAIREILDGSEYEVEKHYHRSIKGLNTNGLSETGFDRVILNVVRESERQEFFESVKELVDQRLKENGHDIEFTKEMFDKHGFYILSADPMVEFDFGPGDPDNKNSSVRVFSKEFERLHKTEYDKLVKFVDDKDTTLSDDELEDIFKVAFKGDPTSENRDLLVRMNIRRIKNMRELSVNGPRTSSIAHIKEGHVLYDVSTKDGVENRRYHTYDQFLAIAKDHGFQVRLDVGKVMESYGKRKRFAAKVWRVNESEAETVFFDAKSLRTTKDFGKYVKEIMSELEETVKSISAQNEELKKNIADKGWKDEDIIRAGNELLDQIKKTRAYNFIGINAAKIQRYKDLFEGVLYFHKGFPNVAAGTSIHGDIIRTRIDAMHLNIKRAIEDRMKSLSDKGESWYRTPFLGDKNTLDSSELETTAYDLTRRVIYLDHMHSSDAMNMEGRDFSTKNWIDTAKARQHVVDLIGEEHAAALLKGNSFLNGRILKEGSSAFYGRLYDSLMVFTTLDGKVHPLVARHESMHWIINKLIDPKSQKVVLADAKAMMRKEGVQGEITSKMAHEYISDIFMDKSYLKKIFPKQSILKRFVNFLSGLISRFTGQQYYSLKKVLQDADRGVFQNAKISNLAKIRSAYDMKVENRFNDYDADKRTREKFIGEHNEDSVINKHLVTGWLHHQGPYSRVMGSPVVPVYKTIMEMKKSYQNFRNRQNEVFEKKLAEGIRTVRFEEDQPAVDMYIQEITPSQYDQMVRYRNADGTLNAYNERIARDYEKYHLGDEQIFYNLSQRVFSNIDLEVLLNNKAVTMDNFGTQMFRSESNNDVNPVGTQSNIINMVLNNMPKYRIDKDGKYVAMGENVESSTLNALLVQTAYRLRERGMVFNLPNWFAEIQKLADSKDVSGNDKNILVSFLLQFGDIGTGNTDMVTTGYDEKGNEIKQRSFVNTGMYKIVSDYYKGFQRPLMSKFTTDKNDPEYQKRINEFQQLLSALKNQYGSLFRNVMSKFDIKYDQSIDSTVHQNSAKNIGKGEVTKLLKGRIYGKDDRISKVVSDGILPGDNNIYTVTKKGVWSDDQLIINADDYKIKEGHAVDILDFLGVDKDTYDVALLRDGPDDNNYRKLAESLHYMLAAVKSTATIQKHMETAPDRKPLSNIDSNKITDGLTKFLDDYYDKNSYQVNSRIMIEGNDYKLDLHSPLDFYRFNEDLGRATQMNSGLTIESVSYNVNGDPTYGHQKTSTFSNYFLRSEDNNEVDLPGGYGKSRNMGDVIRSREITKFIEKQVESALFSSSKWNKDIPNSNNILLNNKMELESLSKINGMTFQGKGILFQNLTDIDKFHLLVEQTREGLLSKSGSVRNFSFMDTLADKTTYPNIIWKYKKDGKNASLYDVTHFGRKGIASISINETAMLDCLKDIGNFYKETKRISSDKWSKLAGKAKRVDASSELGKKMQHNLIKLKDFVITKEGGKEWIEPGLSITQPGNPLMGIEIGDNISPDKAKELFAKVRENFRDHFQAFGEKLSSSGYKMKPDDVSLFSDINVTKLVEEYRSSIDKIVKERGKYPSESDIYKDLDIRVKKMEGSIKLIDTRLGNDVFSEFIAGYVKKIRGINSEIRDYNEEEDYDNPEFESLQRDLKKKLNKEKNAVVGSIGEVLRGNNYMHDGRLHPLAEVMFWNHYIANETMTHLLRGSVYDYKDANDFMKRAAGVLSPGTPFNTEDTFSHIGRKARVLYLEDIKALHDLFGVTAEPGELTNGLIIHNPIWDKMLYLDSGGQAGNISVGSKKTVNSYNDLETGRMVYHKANAYPIPLSQLSNSRFYQEMTRMMLGDEVYGKLLGELKTNNYDDAVMNVIQWLKKDGKQYRSKMIDYVAFRSAVKTGQTRINEIRSNKEGEAVTLDNATFDPSMNHEDNVVYINNDSMLFQLNQRQNPFGAMTTLPLQIGHVVSTLDHNAHITKDINSSIMTMTKAYTDKINGMNRNQLLTHIRKNAIRRSYNSANVGKKLRLLEDDTIDINVVRSVAMQMFLNDAGNNLRPKVPGAFHVQAPSFQRIYFNNEGQAFTARDLKVQHDGMEVDGYSGRQLKPQGYLFKDADGTWKDVLTQDQMKQLKDAGTEMMFRPAEVIAPFRYLYEFGLSKDMTLQNAMTYIDKNGAVKSFYQDGMDGMHEINKDELFSKMSLDFAGLTVNQIIKSFKDPRMQEVIKTKWSKKIHQDDINPELKGEFKEYQEYEPLDEHLTNQKFHNTSDFLIFLRDYYNGFNRALDVYAVRIPTTGANMGTMSRIVAFANDAENMIYTSAEKNFLDDSDYDGDALNVLYRAVDEYGHVGYTNRDKDGNPTDPKKYSQNTFFHAIENYYKNTLNSEFVLTPLSTKKLEDFATRLEMNQPKSRKHMVSNAGLTIENDRIIYDGNPMVGHFANLNNFLTTFMSMPRTTRQQLFPDSTFLADEHNVSGAVNFITSLVQLSTINAGKGGLLGRLNINKYTSPLITGLVFKGLQEGDGFTTIEDKVLTIINSDEVKGAVNHLLSINHIRNGFPQRLWNVIKSPEIREALAVGEQMRRMGDFVSLEGDLGGNPFEVWKGIKNIQKDLGMSIEDFLNRQGEMKKDGLEYGEQMKYFNENYSRNYDSRRRNSFENAVHRSFNMPQVIANLPRVMSYVRMLKAINDGAKSVFYIDQNLDQLMRTIEDKVGRNELFDDTDFESVELGTEQRLIGLFLDTKRYQFDYKFRTQSDMTAGRLKDKLGKLSIRENYNMSRMKDRSDFLGVSQDYVRFLKKKYNGNRFISAITFSEKRNDSQLIMEIPKSNAIDDNRKRTMEADFNKLEENDKEYFRIYNIMVHGIDMHAGSVFDIIDTKIEKEFSNFMELTRKITEEEWDGYHEMDYNDFSKNIIRKYQNLAQYKAKDSPAEWEFHKSNQDRRMDRLMEKNDKGKYEASVNPFPNSMNSHSGINTNTTYPRLFSVTAEEMARLDRGEDVIVDTYHKAKVWGREMVASDKRSPFMIIDGELASINDGELVHVTKINSYKIKITKNLPQKMEAKIDRASSRIASDMIGAVENMVRTALPNVKINRTTSTDPSNPNREGMTFWYNGELWINQDRLQTDIPLHEIAHIPVMILKSLKSPIYKKLRTEAVDLLNHPNADIEKITANYGPGENLIDEVICNIVGWKGENDVMATLMRYQHKEITTIAPTIWGRVKDLIKNVWTKFRSHISTIFGMKNPLTLDLQDATIEGLSKALIHKIKSGEVVSFVSSGDVARLMGNTMLQAKIESESIKDMHGIEDTFFRTTRDPQARKENEIANLIHYMHNDGRVPDRYINNYGEFDPNTPGARKKLEGIIADTRKAENSFSGDVHKWLNSDDNARLNISYYETFSGTQEGRYKDHVLGKLRSAIEYADNVQYVRYSELQNIPEFKHLYDPSLHTDSFDPMIGIDINVPGAYKFTVFDVLPGTMAQRDMEVVKGNLFRNTGLRESQLGMAGIRLENNMEGLRQFQIGVLINHFMQNEIGINNAMIISLSRSKAEVKNIDKGTINDTLRNISKVPEIYDSLSGKIKKVIDSKNLKIYHTDALNDLEIWRRENFTEEDRRALPSSKRMDTKDQIFLLNKRLRHIVGPVDNEQSKRGNFYSTKQLTEMRLILGALEQLKSVQVMDSQLNPHQNNDVGKIYALDMNSIGDEMVQRAREFLGDVNGKVVNEYLRIMDPLRKKNGVFDFFYKRDIALRAKGLFLDTSRSIYKDLFVQAKDSDGNDINLNHIYWTKDEKEDVLWAKQAKERHIGDDVIERGRIIADMIEERLISQLVSMRNLEKGKFVMFKGEKYEDYTREMAMDELHNSGYRKGMIPIIQESSAALWSQGKLGASMKKRMNDFANIYDFMQEAPSDREGENLSKMRDIFTWQFGIGKDIEHLSSWGYNPALESLLGLQQQSGYKDGKMISRYKTIDKKKNQQMSTDLEMIMNFFTMQEIRNRHYEEELLPAINALKILDFNDQNNRDVNLAMKQYFWDDFRSLAVDNKRHKLNWKPLGIDADKVISYTAGSVALPLTLALNMNIPVITAVSNGMFSFMEGISNSLGDALSKQFGMEKGEYFGAGDLLKASKAPLTEFHKLSQIMHDYHIVAMNDYELTSLQFHQKTKKGLFSKWYMNWATWATDYYGRSVVMAAQMMHDGSWDAFVYDKNTGKVNYDAKKDKRLGWDGKKFSEEGEAYLKWVKQQNMIDGFSETDAANRGYTMKETRMFRTLGDKYVVGAYSNKERSLLASYLIGRMFLMFKNWMMSRVENAIGQKKDLNSIGKIHMIKDGEGNFVPEWQRGVTEGYLKTAFNGIRHIIVDRDLHSFAHMEDYQKRNYVKLATNLAMFTAMMSLYNLFVSDKDDKKAVPDIRVVRNFKYSYQSLLVFPMMKEMATKPFAAADILGPYWDTIFGEAKAKSIPFKSQYKTITELGTAFEE